MIAFVLEFVATFFLALFATISAQSEVALVPAVVLASTAYLLYKASVSEHQFHINPVVSICAWVNNRLSLLTTLVYLTAQFTGATIGALAAKFMLLKAGREVTVVSNAEIPAVLSIESLLTFITGFAALLLLRKSQSLAPLASMYLVTDLAISQLITSSANPALTAAALTIGHVPATNGWIYLAAGVFGALASGTVYTVLFGRYPLANQYQQ